MRPPVFIFFARSPAITTKRWLTKDRTGVLRVFDMNKTGNLRTGMRRTGIYLLTGLAHRSGIVTGFDSRGSGILTGQRLKILAAFGLGGSESGLI